MLCSSLSFHNFQTPNSTSAKLQTNGDLFSKLRLAIEYNNKPGEKLDPVTARKWLPIFASSAAPAKNTLTKKGILKKSKKGGHEPSHKVFLLSAT